MSANGNRRFVNPLLRNFHKTETTPPNNQLSKQQSASYDVTKTSQSYAQNPYYKINENKNSKFTLIIVISFLILSSVTVGIIFGTKEGFCIDDDPRIFIVILLILIIYLIYRSN